MVNKKGGISDLFVFMIVAFAMIIVFVILMYVANTTKTALLDHADVIQQALGTGGGNATEIIQNTFGAVPRAYTSLPWISVAIIIGMFISILVTSYLIRTRPIAIVPYILVWIIAIIVSATMSNVYEDIYDTPQLVSTFQLFTGSTYIFMKLPIFITVIGAIAGILMVINLIRQGRYGGYE